MDRNIYASDLTDQEWFLLSDLMPVAKSGGRAIETQNQIMFILQTIK